MTELVGVRFHPEDMALVKQEAQRRGIGVAELLRCTVLDGLHHQRIA
ncbi:hypothetical protein KIH27_18645 [Mycobacterium sp. M1]|uniref:CopG family transcriptional regulator n=1 Tax=Mycolicibacter acidiphilus TaxID=2835306 RepID=A0ABS5RRM8_9MYCO|nr:hypothetical protein [Mycolicibacter acidiphilus]MBS9535609.1 hypothetical protein [Mycolicibacter acidiphilus]